MPRRHHPPLASYPSQVDSVASTAITSSSAAPLPLAPPASCTFSSPSFAESRSSFIVSSFFEGDPFLLPSPSLSLSSPPLSLSLRRFFFFLSLRLSAPDDDAPETLSSSASSSLLSLLSLDDSLDDDSSEDDERFRFLSLLRSFSFSFFFFLLRFFFLFFSSFRSFFSFFFFFFLQEGRQNRSVSRSHARTSSYRPENLPPSHNRSHAAAPSS